MTNACATGPGPGLCTPSCSVLLGSVGLVQDKAPSVGCGLHRDEQIRNWGDAMGVFLSQEGVLFLIPGLVTCLQPLGGG